MPDQRPSPITFPRVLLVEGQDDFHVVEHLRRRYWTDDDAPSFETIIKNNDVELLKSISGEIKTEGREAIGILIDTDDDLTARWQSVRDRLPENFTLADQPTFGGAIINTSPRVGVWLMPDNASPGQLEDFVQRMIPTDDTIWPLAERYIDDIPTPDRKFPPSKTSRAKLYAWLAARQDPRRMGEAIRTRDLATDGDLCQQFVGWLRRLFG